MRPSRILPGTTIAATEPMISSTAARTAVAVPRSLKRPTASLVDGPLDITVYDVLQLHELFEHARLLLRPIAELVGVRGLTIVIRGRDPRHGGSPATEVEVTARTESRPISIRCVRQDARAALELASIVLRLRLTSSDRPEAAAE
jgi:hypothetical protein